MGLSAWMRAKPLGHFRGQVPCPRTAQGKARQEHPRRVAVKLGQGVSECPQRHGRVPSHPALIERNLRKHDEEGPPMRIGSHRRSDAAFGRQERVTAPRVCTVKIQNDRKAPGERVWPGHIHLVSVGGGPDDHRATEESRLLGGRAAGAKEEAAQAQPEARKPHRPADGTAKHALDSPGPQDRRGPMRPSAGRYDAASECAAWREVVEGKRWNPWTGGMGGRRSALAHSGGDGDGPFARRTPWALK
jgi:hypothetical protein